MADYSKIKAEYIAGGISYRELAKKHRVSFNTLKDIAVSEGWFKLRQQAYNDATTRMVSKVSAQSSKIDDKYFRLVDMLMSKAEEVIESTPVWNASAIKEMATAMKNLKECKGVKSEADIREQEARIAKLQKEAQEDEEKNTTVVVQFEEDITRWSK